MEEVRSPARRKTRSPFPLLISTFVKTLRKGYRCRRPLISAVRLITVTLCGPHTHTPFQLGVTQPIQWKRRISERRKRQRIAFAFFFFNETGASVEGFRISHHPASHHDWYAAKLHPTSMKKESTDPITSNCSWPTKTGKHTGS